MPAYRVVIRLASLCLDTPDRGPAVVVANSELDARAAQILGDVYAGTARRAQLSAAAFDDDRGNVAAEPGPSMVQKGLAFVTGQIDALVDGHVRFPFRFRFAAR